ncbi:class I adenylate-forming enzyme family protein [Rhodococcus daqingensis]|uniref:Class I adenylate-forming enzyme family protein n=1 Tax=Rhodococcus daqingensis TaxID=2479363 RepID=A0ABW2RUE2_9NOCA
MSERYGLRSPVDFLLDAEAEGPDAPLLRHAGGTVTVTEFASLVRRCATDLIDRFAVESGDRVALVGRNSVHRLAWQYGAYWIGAVEVSLNFDLKGPMLAHVLTDSEPTLILTDDEFRAEVTRHAGSTRIDALTGPVTEQTDVPPGLRRHLDALSRDHLATILYTSGTTGPSKGVMLPHGYLANNADAAQEMIALTTDDVGHSALPFFHVDIHVIFPAIIRSGSSLYFTERFSVSRFWEQVTTHGCTWAMAVGSMLAGVALSTPPGRADIPLTRVVGAPVPPEVYGYFEDRLGVPVLSTYGQTEAHGISIETIDARRRGSAGRICDAFDVAILSPDGRRLPPGTVGEICHRPNHPAMVLLGYWRRPASTVAAWQNLWYHTGDLGLIDEDGFLFFKGRLTDSLRRRGENISAFELEAVLRTAPGVVDAAAIGVVDELGGEDEIKVFVDCGDTGVLDPQSFFDFCVANLPRFAVPRYVAQVDAASFVRSPGTGVIQKHRLPTRITGAGVYDRLAESGSANNFSFSERNHHRG